MVAVTVTVSAMVATYPGHPRPDRRVGLATRQEAER